MLHAQDTPTPARVAPSRRIARHAAPPGPAVAIIGSGFSGTMAAIHLRHLLPPDHSVLLFDRTGRFARGPAYAATEIAHPLNVRSANMSALPDDPLHFERWLETVAPQHDLRATETGTFASRRLYGRYLRALLFREMTRSGGRVRLCADRAIALAPDGIGWRIRFASGREIVAAAVVLALGNLPAQDRDDGVVFHDPWHPRATEGLRPHETVLIVGTGLTMVDLTLSMQARGFDGPIVAVSRRGLVPQPHAAPHPPLPCPPFDDDERRSMLRLLRAVRRRVSEAASHGVGWRAVLDSLRPATAALWQGLPLPEQRRFLRHLRPYWDSHRHRMAPAAAEAFGQLLDRKSVTLRKGRLRAVVAGRDQADVAVQDHGRSTAETLTVQRVLHATGVGPHAVEDGLIADLVASGHARTDAHGMGLDVTDALQLRSSTGAPTPGLWALGPPVRGVFWECTAVPDIRLQARTLATAITLALRPPISR